MAAEKITELVEQINKEFKPENIQRVYYFLENKYRELKILNESELVLQAQFHYIIHNRIDLLAGFVNVGFRKLDSVNDIYYGTINYILEYSEYGYTIVIDQKKKLILFADARGEFDAGDEFSIWGYELFYVHKTGSDKARIKEPIKHRNLLRKKYPGLLKKASKIFCSDPY